MKEIPVKVQWGLMKQGVVLPHKFTANTLRTRSFHDHDFLLLKGADVWNKWKEAHDGPGSLTQVKQRDFTSGFSPEIFEGVVAFRGVVKLGSITNVTQSAT